MGVLTKDTETAITVEQRSFSKEMTLVTKGVLILMLLTHHLFFGNAIEAYDVITISSDAIWIQELVKYLNICIAGFAFLSAFGITRNLKNSKEKKPKGYFHAACRRLLKLESSVWFIYLCAILYKKFVLHESIKLMYVGAQNQFEPLYLLIDLCGLSTYFGTPHINVTWWYLSFAILLIATMPILYMLYEKFRYALLPVGVLLPVVIFQGNVYFASLLPVVILGIAFAYEDWFEKLDVAVRGWQKRTLSLVICLALLVLSFELCANVWEIYAYPFAFLIAYLAFAYLGRIPGVRHVLMFIGEHATNIFLIHTFIYYYFYPDFIYSFRYSVCIVPALLLISLLVSVVIELLKKVTGYNRLVNMLLNKMKA